MTTTTIRQRSTLRWVHIVVGAALATYVYLPLDTGPAPALRWALMLVGIPAVTISGIGMWKYAALRRWYSART
jgi:hypothetical protein